MRLHINQLQLCRYHQAYSRQDSCLFAHSEEEVNYWKWKIAEEHYSNLVRELNSVIIILVSRLTVSLETFSYVCMSHEFVNATRLS